MNTLQEQRQSFAELVTAPVKSLLPNRRLFNAFASTPREDFVGPAPWRIFSTSGYTEMASDDPSLLYQDVVVALDTGKQINNGQPSLHAACLALLKVQEGETVVHVGAGTGYYTALLSKLVEAEGSVEAYEIEDELARLAKENLAGYENVHIHACSGAEGPLPTADVVYVNAGATSPLSCWLDALHPEGRLMFPLTPAVGLGGMLLVTRKTAAYQARFITQVMFIPCIGARDEEEGQRLAEAFKERKMAEVKSLHRDSTPDDTCWFEGKGWWLSTHQAEP